MSIRISNAEFPSADVPPTKIPHSSQKTSRCPPQNAKDERKNGECRGWGNGRRTPSSAGMQTFALKDAHLVSGRCASFPPKDAHLSNGKYASVKQKMRIRETQALHPPERKPCIRRKSARHLATKRTRSASCCGRCASPVKSSCPAGHASGFSSWSPPPGVVESPALLSPAPGVVSSAEAGSSIHSSCSVSTRARV